MRKGVMSGGAARRMMMLFSPQKTAEPSTSAGHHGHVRRRDDDAEDLATAGPFPQQWYGEQHREDRLALDHQRAAADRRRAAARRPCRSGPRRCRRGVPDGHRLAVAGPVRLAEAAAEHWIGSAPGTICHEWLLRVLPGVRPRHLVGEFETQLTFVAAGLGVALIPRLARMRTVPGTVVVPVMPEPTRRVIVAWRKSSEGRPALGATVSALREAWNSRATATA